MNSDLQKTSPNFNLYHWTSNEQRSHDYTYLRNVYETILGDLADALNSIFSKNESIRYWEIIYGYWLFCFVNVMYDRLKIISAGMDLFSVPDAQSEQGRPPLAVDVKSFVETATYSDQWNHELIHYLVLHHSRRADEPETSIQAIIADLKLMGDFTAEDLVGFSETVRPKQRHFFFKTLISFYRKNYRSIFLRKKVIFFKNSFFSPGFLFRLNFPPSKYAFLGFFHTALDGVFEDRENIKPDVSLRQELCSSLQNNFSDKQFEHTLLSLLPVFVPWTLLEGYSWAQKKLARADHEVLPHAIFTANSHFYGDDLFKIWVAHCTSKGTQFIVSDHGGSFRAKDYLFEFEERMADLYIIGTPETLANHKQLPLSTFVDRCPRVESTCGKTLLLITYGTGKWAIRSSSQPQSFAAFSVVQLLEGLVDLLPDTVKNDMVVKLAPSSEKWSELDDAYAKLGYPLGKVSRQPLKQELTNARVVVCTYPQTTYTDAFLAGCPVILLYDPSISVLEESAMDLISEMLHENMCFYDYATAASHIQQIWHDPLEWWNSDAVMRVRNLFATYAKLDEKDKISVWGQFFSHI